ncbi:MAG: SMC-Scp complex subunit ScpB [Endomicrobium sp.]|jgi:segregation and condensation protein B|nr:SMC-Scp complex subunit ScpB [Endomicrobium sp.]
MEVLKVKQILEAVLFACEKPLNLKELKEILKPDYSDTSQIEDILNELRNEYIVLNKPYEIKFIAGGWTFATKPEYSIWIKKILKEKAVLRLSPSALETLAIIAYKQPITKMDIDNIRGIDSSGVIATLLEKKLIKIAGKKEALGRPSLYGTTHDFLKHFGLTHLNELPVIDGISRELRPIDSPPEMELSFGVEDSTLDTAVKVLEEK